MVTLTEFGKNAIEIRKLFQEIESYFPDHAHQSKRVMERYMKAYDEYSYFVFTGHITAPTTLDYLHFLQRHLCEGLIYLDTHKKNSPEEATSYMIYLDNLIRDWFNIPLRIVDENTVEEIKSMFR